MNIFKESAKRGGRNSQSFRIIVKIFYHKTNLFGRNLLD